MFFEKQVFDELSLHLAPEHMAAQRGHHLNLVARTALAQGMGLHILFD